MRLCPRRFRWDVAERTFWTAVEGCVAGGATLAANLPPWAMLPLLVLAAFAKSYTAGKIGALNTASTLSADRDPAAQGVVPPGGGAG